jgi:hypothetical protein
MSDNVGLPMFVVRVWGEDLCYELNLYCLDKESATTIATSIVKDKKDPDYDKYTYEVLRVK